MSIRICLAGAGGGVGRQLTTAILDANDLELVSAVGRSSAGKPLSDIVGDPRTTIKVSGSIVEALSTNVDVLIDYTKPDAVLSHVITALEHGVNVVVGTSGLSDDDYRRIDERARAHSLGVIAAGNFSLTATLLQHFAQLAAQHISHWEIFDFAPDTKPDAPSGTSRELAFQLGKIQQPTWAVPPDEVHGARESRGAALNGSQIHSARIPGFYSSSEIVFGLPGERLSLRHDSISSAPYVQGTLLAARKVVGSVGLKRGLATILGLAMPAER